MAYYGSQPEQTKAQIRSTRGETIDLALPPTCLVGELRTFLIDEYNYDPNTRLLYNGLVADDTSYVCDYPFGSLMIATPADTQNQRQRQQPQQQQQQQQHQPQQQEQHHRQHHRQQHQPQHQQEQHHRQQQQQEQHQRQLPQQQQTLPEPGRMNGRPSPTVSTNADTVRKNKAAEPAETQTNAAAREISSAEAPQEVVKAKGMNTAPRHCRRSSSPHLRSMSTESSGSQAAATNNGGLPAPGSGRAPSSTGQRCSPGPQSSQDAPAPPTQTPRPPPSPQSAAGEVPNSQCDNDVGRQRQQVQLTVECHIPSLNQVVPVVVSGESSVSDVVLALAAAVPALAPDAQVVYHGRTLPNSVHAKLFDYGIRSDTRVFIAAGEYRNTEKITLLEIEDDTSIIERATKSPMTDLQRKGYYEELMRILFRTDGLQSLEGEWRQRRKDAVRHITALQDALGVEGKVF
ncbi:hypothetical protein JKF63_04345 [Porcisia hertigi]|uniref:BAG domain-containing protein n=1 Tax=Porcisia hertigi TaxID=2761500 RepID=A0A836I4I5_9TRYP|nr:hypothetical protein JKF63_04345 [Porcisia hertigi]